MTARILDGEAIARRVRAGYRERVQRLAAAGITPGLAVVLVDDDPAAQVYVAKKVEACRELGLHSQIVRLPPYTAEDTVLEHLRALNADPRIHGVLVQLPLPAHYDINHLAATIDRDKDVDGFHLQHLGGLVIGDSAFPPCAPYGVRLLLEHAGIAVEGRNAVVVGAGNFVGKPMALLLLAQGATVTVCHEKTRDLAQFTTIADLLVVAAGQPGLITAELVRPGAVVIDIGINRLPNGRVTGDVDFESVRQKASFITPVPGGMGPMTVAVLLGNTLTAAERRLAALQNAAAAATR